MSEADKMLEKIFDNKQEYYNNGKLKWIKYETNYKYVNNTSVKFYLEDELIEIEGQIDFKELQAIIMKCKELGWI